MRRQGLLWLNAALCVIPASLFAGAAVEGHVDLPKSHSAPVQAKRYEIVTKAGVLSTQPPLAVIYLEGNFPRPASLPTKEVEQKDLTFIPALLPIEVGTKVQFPNLDDQYHNIFSYSPAKRFDLGRYRPEERPIPSVTFDQAGPRDSALRHSRAHARIDPRVEHAVLRDDRHSRPLSIR